MRGAVAVAPRLVFGPYTVGLDPAALATVTHIVNCDDEERTTPPVARELALGYAFLPSADSPSYDILGHHLAQFAAFVDAALASSPTAVVWVHCYQGVNRSAALAIAYAASRGGERASSIIKRARSVAAPRAVLTNAGFEEALLARYH
jgi:protein-tyrosine phosphatase